MAPADGPMSAPERCPVNLPSPDLQPPGAEVDQLLSGPSQCSGRGAGLLGEGRAPCVPFHEFTTCQAVMPKSNQV